MVPDSVVHRASYCGLLASQLWGLCSSPGLLSFLLSVQPPVFPEHRNAAILPHHLGGWDPEAGFLPIQCPESTALLPCPQSRQMPLPSEAQGLPAARFTSCHWQDLDLRSWAGCRAPQSSHISDDLPSSSSLAFLFSTQTKALVSKTICLCYEFKNLF